MLTRELVARFKSAQWRSLQDVEGFAAQFRPLPPADVVRLADLLCDRSLAQANPVLHRMRCKAFALLTADCAERAVLAPLLKALKSADSLAQEALAPVLTRTQHVGAHPELAALLRSPDAQLRRTGAGILRQLPGRSIFTLVSALLEEPAFPGRVEALDVIFHVGGARAATPALLVLRSGTTAERTHAIRGLAAACSERCPPEVLDAVAAQLRDPDEQLAIESVRALAACADEAQYLDRIGFALEAPNVRIACAALQGLRRFPTARAAALLLRALREGPDEVRLAAIETLEVAGTGESLPVLVAAIGTAPPAIAKAAARALEAIATAGRLRPAAATAALLSAGGPARLQAAKRLLPLIGDGAARELLTAIRPLAWFERRRALGGLIELAGAAATAPLIEWLKDADELVRVQAAELLGGARATEALAPLLTAVRGDPCWLVRENAVAAIGGIGDARAAPQLMELLAPNGALRRAAMEALATLGHRAAAPRVAASLADPDPDVRATALRCLKQLDARDHAEAVKKALADPEAAVRAEAQAVHAAWGVESVAGDVRAAPPLDRLLAAFARSGGDDLIVAPGRQPAIKRMGGVQPLTRQPLTAAQIEQLLRPHLTPAQLAQLDAGREVDLTYEVESDRRRYRVNLFKQLGGLSAVFRVLRRELPTLESLGLPPVVESLAGLHDGLVLVGGATGSGKSTTLASLIDRINRTQARHVVCLEDPIEVVHANKAALMTQREIGTHARSFSSALQAALRQDANVILVGEMRDLATISMALAAAETGHLVVGTIHTVSADSSVDRLINAFPAGEQEQARSALSQCLRAVVCQNLVRKVDGSGRALAVEVLLNTDAVANLIRTGKTFQLGSVMATGREQGMQTMDTDLLRLLEEGAIAPEEAYLKARNKSEFEARLAPESSAAEPPAPKAAMPHAA